jgi:hypothetical protein
VAAIVTLAALPAIASASATTAGVEHLNYAAGPYSVIPGANLILTQTNGIPKPNVDGFLIRMAPDLRYALPNGKCCGKVPLTKNIHLHHGVWLSDGQAGEGEGNNTGPFYPFMGSGEEKTIVEFPKGFGYPIGAKDHWILNYMIHNLTDKPAKVYITYKMEFVPATSPLASTITPVHPIWTDVENHHVYSVFNVRKGSGVHGKYTFPNMAKDPYRKYSAPLNRFTIDHAGTLIGTAGHLHPGGLWTELDLSRPGVKPGPGILKGRNMPNSVRLFRSYAHYFDKRGPVSWDVAMGATDANWRPLVKPGDVLSVSATYDSKIASWYEVMGIMVVWEAYSDSRGVDPFTHQLNQKSHLTHGHLPENSYYGGSAWIGVNPTQWAECAKTKVIIAGFRYLPGDFSSKGATHCIPTITKGHSLEFVNEDANPMGTFNILAPNPFYLESVFHTVTSCKKPCDLNYGIAYPVSDGNSKYAFDSGELGVGLPGVGRLTWSTPANLPPGTYTFFCRIHPWMRGVFRIVQ